MLVNQFVKKAKAFALAEQKRTAMPVLEHLYLSSEVGIRLARKLNADEQIVEAGTYLMDCMIGQALKEGRLPDHIKMSAAKAEELLKNSDLSVKDQENIKHCVSEHHGVKKFYSLESEICCNADCYRFISVKGFTYSLRSATEMSFNDLIKLLEAKAEEKWNALSLKVCKDELEPQYKLISQFLKELKS